MARTYEAIPVDEAVGERPAIVGAGVGNTKGATVLEGDDGHVFTLLARRNDLAGPTLAKRLLDVEAILTRRIGILPQ